MLSETQKTIPSPSYAPTTASHLISQRGWARVVRVEDGALVEIVEILKENFFPNGLPNSSVVLLSSGTNLKCQGGIMYEYAMDWLECEHKMREVCPLFPIFPVDGGGSVYKSITDIGK